jgi:hypothetical protein
MVYNQVWSSLGTKDPVNNVLQPFFFFFSPELLYQHAPQRNNRQHNNSILFQISFTFEEATQSPLVLSIIRVGKVRKPYTVFSWWQTKEYTFCKIVTACVWQTLSSCSWQSFLSFWFTKLINNKANFDFW